MVYTDRYNTINNIFYFNNCKAICFFCNFFVTIFDFINCKRSHVEEEKLFGCKTKSYSADLKIRDMVQGSFKKGSPRFIHSLKMILRFFSLFKCRMVETQGKNNEVRSKSH